MQIKTESNMNIVFIMKGLNLKVRRIKEIEEEEEVKIETEDIKIFF